MSPRPARLRARAAAIAGRLPRLDPYWLLVLLCSLFPLGPLLQPGYFWSAHDARHSVYFLFEFNQAIQDGVLYPRWAPDFAFGYGYPFFNIYGPLSSYLGELFYLLGFDYVNSVKIVFGLSVVISGLAMYGFAQRSLAATPRAHRRARPAALVAAVAYMVVPYHLFNLYVRAALAESVALALVPLLFWGVEAALHRPRTASIAGLSLALAALILTSQLVTLLVTPVLVIYGLVLAQRRLGQEQPWRALSRESFLPLLGHLGHVVLPVAVGALLGLGLSAIFWMPMLVEYSDVRVDQWYGGRYAWGGDFVYLFQLFSPTWGFGTSVPGPGDDLSFQLGAVPVALSILSLSVLRRSRGRLRWQVALFALLTAGAVFLMLSISGPVWDLVGLARFAQFPWRLLALASFGLSLLSGAVLAQPEGGSRDIPALFLAGLLLLGSYPYMQAQVAEPTPTQGPVSLAALMRFQQSADEMTGSTRWVQDIPTWSPMAEAIVRDLAVTTKVDYAALPDADPPLVAVDSHWMDSRSEKIWVYAADDQEEVIFHRFYYPGWTAHLYADDPEREDRMGTYLGTLPIRTTGSLGRITVTPPRGTHVIILRFEDTPVRRLGTAATLLSLSLLAGAVVLQRWLLRGAT